MKNRVSLEKLKRLVTYYPDAGVFVWEVTRSQSALAGAVAGFIGTNGYLRIRIDGREYQVSHLAWFWTYGEWPENFIDHRNLDVLDNRISNLRSCSRWENNANRRTRKDNQRGIKGITYVKRLDKWMARISVDGAKYYLGCYPTSEEAKSAYDNAAAKYHGEFARLT